MISLHLVNETIQMLQEFLKKEAEFIKKNHPQPNWKYSSFEELVLDIGMEMLPIALTSNIKPAKPKSCYFNCLEIIKKRLNFIYCEGYAIRKEVSLPLRHAWLLPPNKKAALDPTWVPAGIEYIGVPFNNKWVQSFWKLRNQKNPGDYLSIFEENFLENSSFLKDGLPDNSRFKLA